MLANDFGHRARADEVVHDGFARVPVEDPGRDDRRGRRAADRLPRVVDEEHAIGVAVECEPDVGTEIEHRRAWGEPKLCDEPVHSFLWIRRSNSLIEVGHLFEAAGTRVLKLRHDSTDRDR